MRRLAKLSNRPAFTVDPVIGNGVSDLEIPALPAMGRRRFKWL